MSKVGLVVLGAAASLWAQAPVTITAKDATVLLNGDGSSVVIERVSLARRVNEYQSDIRVRRRGAVGDRTAFVDLLGVADVSDLAAEQAWTCHTRIRGDVLEIACSAKKPTSELKLEYAVRNAVEFWGDHDEFYYATGGAAANTSMRIVLPAAAQGQFRAQSFLRFTATAPKSALWSSDGRLPIQIEGATITTAAPGPLLPQVEMVTNVFLTKGLITPPNPMVRAGWFVRANPILLFPVAVLFFMLTLRRLKGRGARADRSVAPMYEPPDGLTPAEAGVLIDDRMDARDVAASFVDLAVRGYIRIEECAAEDKAAAGMRDFIFRKLRDDWGELPAHERTMMFHTFYGGQWTKLSSLRLRFPEIVPLVRAEVIKALREKRMYRVDPERAQTWRMVGVAGLAVLLVVAQWTGVMSLFASPWLGGAMLVTGAAIVYLLGRRLTAKTYRGMRTYTALLGLQEFIQTVVADQLERVDGNKFEALLPYAMALGLEHRWTRVFEGIAVKAPDWYGWANEQAFNTLVFAGRLEGLSQASPTVMFRMRGRRKSLSAEAPGAEDAKTNSATASHAGA